MYWYISIYSVPTISTCSADHHSAVRATNRADRRPNSPIESSHCYIFMVGKYWTLLTIYEKWNCELSNNDVAFRRFSSSSFYDSFPLLPPLASSSSVLPPLITSPEEEGVWKFAISVFLILVFIRCRRNPRNSAFRCIEFEKSKWELEIKKNP